MREPRPLSARRWAALYFCDAEWERAPNSKHEVHIWEPLDTDAPADAHASWNYDTITFWAQEFGKQKRHSECRIHQFSGIEGTLLYVGDRGTGFWYEVSTGHVVYREGRWYVRWSGWKNSRVARAANAMMIAFRADGELPSGATVLDLAEVVQADGAR